MNTPTLRIALPKGRMSEESLEFLFEKNICGMKKFPDSRKLIFNDEKSGFEFLLVRSKDVGTYVEQGCCDIGIMGYDLLAEHSFEVLVPTTLPFGECDLCVAYSETNISWQNKRNIRIATKYPKLASSYFFKHGYNTQIIELYGSIEIAPLTGLSDAIVDLVSTGSTLKENNLTRGETILKSSARCILNPSSYAFKKKLINKFLDQIM